MKTSQDLLFLTRRHFYNYFKNSSGNLIRRFSLSSSMCSGNCSKTGNGNNDDDPPNVKKKPRSPVINSNSSSSISSSSINSKLSETINKKMVVDIKPQPPSSSSTVRGQGLGGPGKKRERSDTSMERNFITPLRAMADFLLSANDLEGLRKTMRRSPHADEPPITVLWRKDVEAKAKEVWGNLDELADEKTSRNIQKDEYHEAVFNMKKILKQYRRQQEDKEINKATSSLLEGSGRIVLTAVAINFGNTIIKLAAWWLTGSHSMFAESIHSLADTINQLILAFGIHKSAQRANVDHPYGYTNMRNVASLISGVGIFCIGAGLSIYHGILGLFNMAEMDSLFWAFCILAGSFVSEGATLLLAVNSVRKTAKELNISFKDFILRGRDPSISVVILEDTAAVSGVCIAAVCMGLTAYLGSPIPDAIGSIIIGGLLGGVASFIIYTNSGALVGKSIPFENLEKINSVLEQDVMVRAIHDVKGIDIGNMLVRYKAEVDFDGRELTRAYMDRQDLEKILDEVRTINTTDELEGFLLKHGENIVDTLGAEIDRIEKRLKKSHPEIRHCDLEIL